MSRSRSITKPDSWPGAGQIRRDRLRRHSPEPFRAGLPRRASKGGWALTRILNAGIQLFASAVSKILGGEFLADISAFVAALDSVFGGFRKRADETYKLLKASGSAFIVVAIPQRDPIREAEFFIERLNHEGAPLAGVMVN